VNRTGKKHASLSAEKNNIEGKPKRKKAHTKVAGTSNGPLQKERKGKNFSTLKGNKLI